MTSKKPKNKTLLAKGEIQEDGSIEFDNDIVHTTLTPLKNLKFKDEEKEDKGEIIDDLIDQLNNLEKKCRFWQDSYLEGFPMGDIVGIVPISRTITKSIGGHFFPFDKKIDQVISKFVVIDVCIQKDLDLTKCEINKQSNFEEYGIEYIKHFDINYIIGRVESII